jgi:hypothetical protein
MTKGQVDMKYKKICYKVRLTICSTSLSLLDWLVDNFGGNYVAKPIKKGMELKHSKSYNWNLHCEKAAHLIEMVLPYLVIKKQQAELVFAYRKIQALRTKCAPGVFRVPPELREEIFLMMKSLNHRGPESVTTNTPDLNEMLRKIESELIRNDKNGVCENPVANRESLFTIL